VRPGVEMAWLPSDSKLLTSLDISQSGNY